MAPAQDVLTPDSESPSRSARPASHRSSREIRSEIDRARADLDETFAALDAKLTPSQLGLEAWHLLKGGSASGAGKLWRMAREHPMPTAVIGLGLGWLLVETSRSEDGRASDRGSYRTRYAADFEEPAQDEPQALKRKAGRQVRRVRSGFRRTLEDNPLLVGAATLAAGVLAGLALPETDREHELMGETRDRLFDEAREVGRDTLEKGRQVVEAVAGTVKEDVKNVARDAVSTARQEAENRDLVPEALKAEASVPQPARA